MGARQTKSRSRTNRKTRARRRTRRDARRAAPAEPLRDANWASISPDTSRADPRASAGVTGREDHERGAASSAPASHENEINKVLLRPRARAFHLSSFDEQRGGP